MNGRGKMSSKDLSKMKNAMRCRESIRVKARKQTKRQKE